MIKYYYTHWPHIVLEAQDRVKGNTDATSERQKPQATGQATYSSLRIRFTQMEAEFVRLRTLPVISELWTKMNLI